MNSKKIIKKVFFLSVLFSFILALITFVEARTMSSDDILNIKKIQNVLLSPDGTKILFLQDGQIYFGLINTSNISYINIDQGSAPQWSADSKFIFYLKKTDAGPEIFTFILPEGEISSFNSQPELLINNLKNIERFKWSPDGSKLALLIKDANELNVTCSSEIKIYKTTEDKIAKNLWLFDPETKKIIKVTDEPNTIITFDWSPNSKKIVYSVQEDSSIKQQLLTKAYILDLTTNGVSGLIPNVQAKDLPCWFPRWSSDGKFIYYQTINNVKDYWLGNLCLALVDLNSNKVKILENTGHERINGVYGYSAENKTIYYKVEQGFGYNLYGVNVETGLTNAITKGSKIWEEFTFAKNFSKIAFIQEDVNQPAELYISDFPKIEPNKITTFNNDLAELELGKSELINWKSNDGTIIEGMLLKPVNFDLTKKYPLIVLIHGGPASCFSSRFANGRWAYPTQILAANDFCIFMPNPRGSTGYGEAYKRALVKNWGKIDYTDIMSGLDYLLKEKPYFAADKIGIAGWSYGGYMVASIITQTNRFKVASMGGGFCDLVSIFGTTDVEDWITSYFNETPYQNPQIYHDFSPLYKVAKINTPVLIQHGEKDIRVPLGQAKEFFRALKTQNKTAELIIYPNEGHILKNQTSIKDSLKRNLNWFEKYLK